MYSCSGNAEFSAAITSVFYIYIYNYVMNTNVKRTAFIIVNNCHECICLFKKIIIPNVWMLFMSESIIF